jgi:hypothetical protein
VSHEAIRPLNQKDKAGARSASPVARHVRAAPVMSVRVRGAEGAANGPEMIVPKHIAEEGRTPPTEGNRRPSRERAWTPADRGFCDLFTERDRLARRTV